ncbi:ribonuclease H-like domain-containing protein, partial [Tanacetum coccineum]
AKTLWEAIKSRFGGNKESKKTQKTILKHQYENFTASRSKGLDKTYDRFQKIISQLEIHGKFISQEDANLKLLRSLPSAWNNIALIMRNKADLDELSMDDLYNNLKVYEDEIKSQSSSSSSSISQNVAFVSSDDTSSTNEAVNTVHDVPTARSKGQASSSAYADDVMFSFFVNQSNSPQLDNEDLEAPRNQGNRNGDAPRRIVPVEIPANALVVQDGIGGYDWSYQAEEEPTYFALMAHLSSGSSSSSSSNTKGNPQYALQGQWIFNSGCSRHMTGNKSYLIDYQDIDRGFVAFAGSPKGGEITRKGKIRTRKLDFEDVYFVKELKFNIFSVSQMCDKKNSILFTETKCLVLSPDFKLLDESQVLLKVPRQNNMYSFDLKNVVPSGGLTYLFTKATIDESNLWHRRLCHINFKTMNKPVRGNLVRDLPSKLFENDHTCDACQKGKQHKACCKTKLNRVLVTKPHNKTPYELLHGRPPSISFMRPFGCIVTILNTLDPLGKFDGKADEGFLVGYSINIKAFRVFNTRTRKVEGNLHINFLENRPNVAGSVLDWLFDIVLLTNSMSYEPVTAGNQTNRNAEDAIADDAGKKITEEPANKGERNGQEKEGKASNKEGD